MSTLQEPIKVVKQKKAMELLNNVSRTKFLKDYAPQLTKKKAENGRDNLFLYDEVMNLAKRLKINEQVITNYQLIE